MTYPAPFHCAATETIMLGNERVRTGHQEHWGAEAQRLLQSLEVTTVSNSWESLQDSHFSQGPQAWSPLVPSLG